ncbi:ABC transporter permease [Flavobacteriaceae bacterium]|nr:ABC transporter permease [Flavobacteriaceae bacterium]
MNHTRLIIAREYLTQVKNKKFLLITLSIPFLFVGLGLFLSFLSNTNSDSTKNISVVDNSGIFENSLLSSDTVIFSFLEDLDEGEAKLISKERNDDGLIFIPPLRDAKNINYVELSKSIKFISEEAPTITMVNSIETKLEEILTNLNFVSVGLDMSTIEESKIYLSILQESFEGEETTKLDSGVKVLFGLILGLLLYGFVFIYGSMILRSVLEEKTSRIIEIIISSVKPNQLMMGKIIGTSLVAFTQILIWTILVFVISTLASSLLGVSTSELNSVDLNDPQVNSLFQSSLNAIFNLPLLNILIAFVFFFISGLFLYGSLFAAVGAAVDSETDANQFMLPLSMPLIIGLYAGMLTVSEDPSGTIPTIFSHIPFTSPIVMMMRIPYGVPIYEQLISLSILIVTFFAIVWFAAKIYRVGILMYGQKPSYKDLYKWLKY